MKLVAMIMLGAGAPAIAQQADKPAMHQKGQQFKNMTVAERVEKRLEQMDKQLDLTDAQVAQLRPILTEDIQRLQNAREAMKAARTADKTQDKATRESARDEMKAQLQVTKDRIAAVLTPEQREKAAAKMTEKRANMRENIKARHGKKLQGAEKQELKKEMRLQHKLEKKNAK
jgi:protein CpxP